MIFFDCKYKIWRFYRLLIDLQDQATEGLKTSIGRVLYKGSPRSYTCVCT